MTEDVAFAAAHAAIDAHELDVVREILDGSPGVVAAEGENGNDLLGMATATCEPGLVELLLEHGADPAHGNVHGWTALHQAAYVGRPDLARILLDAGAPHDRSARGDGGTPLIVALFWGHRETAALLAERELVPRNLRAAAGLDRAELVDELAGTPAAGEHRAFHRPHGGFPEWTPSDDPREVVDEALSWAARNDAVAAIAALLAHGARVDADVYRGTALTWAAACGRVAALRALLDAGADPNHRGTFGGPSHGQGTTALHHAAEAGRLEAISVLLDAGADPAVRDELYDSTPAGWAAEFGRHEAAELLR